MYRILLIEDHPLYRGVLYDTLSASFPFIDIVQAADTGSALQAVDERPPDLVLTGIHLGSESGLELIKTIKSIHNDIVIIVLTSHDLPEYQATACRYGAQDFLSKHHCTPEMLCGAVRRHLDTPDDSPNGPDTEGHEAR